MSKSKFRNKARFRTLLAKEITQLQLNKEKLNILEKSFINREQANTDIRSLHTQVRENWRLWPAEVAPELAQALNVDPVRFAEILQHYVDTHLDELGDHVRTF